MKSCAIFCRITSISLIGLWVYDFIHTPSGQPHLAIVVVSPLHSPWVKQAEFNQGCRKLSTSMVSKSAHLNSKGQICQQAAFHALLFRLLASIDKENKLLCMHVFTHQHPWSRKPRYSCSKNLYIKVEHHQHHLHQTHKFKFESPLYMLCIWKMLHIYILYKSFILYIYKSLYI